MVDINIELEVPSSLSSMPLWKYQKYMKIVEQNKGLENEEAIEFVNRKLIEIFCGVSLKDVMNIPMKSYNKISTILSNAFQEETPLVRTFEIEGVEFGFVPNLDGISYGEYVDIEKSLFDWQNIHVAMGALYRPIIKKYDDKYRIEDYDANDSYYELMKSMPLNVTMGAMVFFYRLGKDLSAYTLKSLGNQKEGLNTRQQQILRRSGDSINQYIHSLEEMFLNTKKSLVYLPINV